MNVSDEDQNETYDEDNTSSESAFADDALLRAKWPEYEISYQMLVIAGLLIIIVGSVCHVLSLTVLLGSKRMRLLPLSVYLVANTFAGLATLYVGLLRWVIKNQFHVDVRDLTSDFGCSLHVVLTYMSLQLFYWLQAATAVDRTVAVLRPLHYKRWCTWRHNVTIDISVILLLGTLNVVFGSLYHENTKGRCAEYDDQQILFFDVWHHIHAVLFSFFPIAVIVPCNVLTLHTIYRSRTQSSVSGRKHIQVTIMLLVQNCVCFATTLPISMLYLLPWPDDEDSAEGARRELEWTTLILLQYLGTTCGFFIYSISARRFRRSIAELLLKGCNAHYGLAQPAVQLTRL